MHFLPPVAGEHRTQEFVAAPMFGETKDGTGITDGNFPIDGFYHRRE